METQMRIPQTQVNKETGIRCTFERLTNGDIKCRVFNADGSLFEQAVVSIQDARRFAAQDRKNGFKALRRRGNAMTTAFGPFTPVLS